MSAPTLEVVDSRTQRLYTIPIHNGDIIRASDIASIVVPDEDAEAKHLKPKGLRILDKGFENTAICESSITKMLVQTLRISRL